LEVAALADSKFGVYDSYPKVLNFVTVRVAKGAPITFSKPRK